MPAIMGLSGSARTGSYNSMLLRALIAAAPPDVTFDIVNIREIPLYDGDWEASHGIPESVTNLKDRLAAAAGLLIVTPEYNNSIPGVLKNVIDWMSRPAADIQRVFRSKPVALAGATPGPGGTLLAQAAWLPVLRTLGMRPWFEGRLGISGAAKVFDAGGAIADEATLARVRAFIEGFAAFAGADRH
jgi:chromate reductase